MTPTATATPVAAWTTTAIATPGTVRVGGTVAITASVTSTTATSALVDMEVYSASGERVHAQVFDNQSFMAGTPRSFSTSWQVATGTPAGTYTVMVGIFNPGWGTLYYWNDTATTVLVTQ